MDNIPNKLNLIFCIVLLSSCRTMHTMTHRNLRHSPDINIIKSIEAAISERLDTLFIPKGDYFIDNEMKKPFILHKSLVIKGEKGTKIRCNKNFIKLESEGKKTFELLQPLSRGDSTIRLTQNRTIREGDILIITSNIIAELGWNYVKKDNHKIKKINPDGSISLFSSLNFPYNPHTETLKIEIYSPNSLTLVDLDFEFNFTPKGLNYGINLRGLSFIGKGLSLINKGHPGIGALIQILDGYDVNISTVLLQNVLYGCVLSNVRDCYAYQTIVYDCRHPYVPANWADNLTFDKINGTNSTIDAHPSFNITYKNVNINTGDDFFNCRALGVTLINCIFRPNIDYNFKAVALGMVTLTKEFEYLYYEYDVILNNVEWVHNSKEYNGLHVNKVRKFHVINSKTHKVSTGAECKEVLIENTQLGQFSCASGSFEIKNSVFDAKLVKGFVPLYAIDCRSSGLGIIQNTNFNNYNKLKSYLLNHLQYPKHSRLSFKNCRIDNFKGIARTFKDKNQVYKGVEFTDCLLENIDLRQKNIVAKLNKTN